MKMHSGYNPQLDVPPVETCFKLKAAGYPQRRCGWYWVSVIGALGESWMLMWLNSEDTSEFDEEDADKFCYAPTTGELLSELKESDISSKIAEALAKIWLEMKKEV